MTNQKLSLHRFQRNRQCISDYNMFRQKDIITNLSYSIWGSQNIPCKYEKDIYRGGLPTLSCGDDAVGSNGNRSVDALCTVLQQS